MKENQITARLSDHAFSLVVSESTLRKCSKSEAIEALILRSARDENQSIKEPEILQQLRALDRKIFALHKTAKIAEILIASIAALGKNEAEINTIKAIKEAAKKRALEELKGD
ncbi:hypothetical protein FACS1894103_2030 [Campylobacterota bacterium]|nr:hypothetical protein FACS1894103_2030 [Campylobacterota bacterium]